ncbi:MAG: hypothetical protein NLN65_06165, partial [Candidatus Poseidoniaceae archaeon]|nr:hypothetical protein [Candidatus Poseidoniaceae archaeon]
MDEIKKGSTSHLQIFNRAGLKYNFTIKAKDVYKYDATDKRQGCRFVTGEVTFQCGHSPACKKRMMELMKDDPQDKHRVRNWCIEKGIDAPEAPDVPEAPADTQRRAPEPVATKSKQPTPTASSTSSSSSSKQPTPAPEKKRKEPPTPTPDTSNIPPPQASSQESVPMDQTSETLASRKRRADSDDEDYWKQVTAEAKKKSAAAAEGLTRTASDRLEKEGATSSEPDKTKTLLCLNLISAGRNSLQQPKALEQIRMD